MNILITGASGFLGRSLSAFLKNNGHSVVEVNSKNIDLTDDKSITKIPKISYDQIFHLAAWTRAGSFCEKFQGDQWIINQKINTNILNWWKINCPHAKMIAFGTSASYASDQKLIEENYMNGIPIKKFYSYAMTKRMLLAGLKSLNNQYGMNYLYLVPSTLYGPNYHTDGRELHFIYDVIKKIINAKNNNGNAILFGDGYQKREIIYINDFVQILYYLSNNFNNEIFNIGSGEEYTIREFSKICCQIINFPEENINFNSNEYVGLKSKVLDITKLENIFKNNYFKKTELKVGLFETINWVNNNINLL